MIWDKIQNPMECKLVKEPPTGADGNLYQEKIDGGRIIAEIGNDNHSIYMWSSNHIQRAYRYPEVVNAIREIIKVNHFDGRVILDGEMAVRVNGVWNFEHGFLPRQVDVPFRIKYLANKMPATYNIFHILEWNGEDMIYRKLSEVVEILKGIKIPDYLQQYVRVLPFYDDPKTVLQIPNTEGIVWKNPDSIYEDGGRNGTKRSGAWKKWRYYIKKQVKVIDLEHTDGGVTVTVIDSDNETYRVAINGGNSREAIERWETDGEFMIEMQMKKPLYEGEKRFPTFKRFVGGE